MAGMSEALCTREEAHTDLKRALAAAVDTPYSIDLTISEKVEQAESRLEYLRLLNAEIIALGSMAVRREETIAPHIFPRGKGATGDDIAKPSSSEVQPNAFKDFVLSLDLSAQLELLRIASEIGHVHYEAITALLSLVAVEALRKVRHGFGGEVPEIDVPLQQWEEIARTATADKDMDQLVCTILETASGLRQDIPDLDAFASFREAMRIYQGIESYPDRLRRTYDEYHDALVAKGAVELGNVPVSKLVLYMGAEEITPKQWCELFVERRVAYEKQRTEFGLLKKGIDNAIHAKEVRVPSELLAELMGVKAGDREGQKRAALLILILRTFALHLSDTKFTGNRDKTVQIWQQRLARALEDGAAYDKIYKKIKPIQASQRPPETNNAIKLYEDHTKLADLIQQLRQLMQDEAIKKMLTSKITSKGRGQRNLGALMSGPRLKQVEKILCEYDMLPEGLELLSPEEELEIDWRIEGRVKALDIFLNAFRVEGPKETEEPTTGDEAPPELESAIAALDRVLRQAQSARGRRSELTAEALARFDLDVERINLNVAARQGYKPFGVKPTVVEGHLNMGVDEVPYVEYIFTLPDGREVTLALHMRHNLANLCHVGPPGSSLEALQGDRLRIKQRSGGTARRTKPGTQADMLGHAEILRDRMIELEVPPWIAQILPDTLKANRENGTALLARPAAPWKTPSKDTH
jgi:hypothetical protein